MRKKFDTFIEHSQQEQAAASHAPLHVLQVHSCPPTSVLDCLKGSTRSHLECHDSMAGSDLRCIGDIPLQELAEMNLRYEAKFGHIFIVCASGKSAQDHAGYTEGQASKWMMTTAVTWSCSALLGGLRYYLPDQSNQEESSLLP